MGKKQHSKDRMFITKTEWATEWGGAKAKDLSVPFKRLPFYCCSLTFTPFEEAVCTAEGSVFDLMNIVPYIKKYGRHPVTGAPLGLGDLIPITFHKNAEGEFHCPVLNKVFTEFTHIVAVKNTGNVFCYEAIKELNIKPKNWKELLTDEPFKKEDLITIQNPNELDKKVLLDFDHVKKSLKVDDEERKKMSEDPTYNINVTGDIKQMLRELGTEQGKQTALLGGGGNKAQKERAAALAAILSARSRIKEDGKSSANGEHKVTQSFSIVDAASASVHGRSAEAAKAAPSDKTVARIAMHMAGERTPVNAKLVKSRFTSGAASRSFTSTAYDPVTKNDFEYVKVEKNPKKKGYVQLHTTHGDLNIELHCDLTPRTCENFITLCERGYYNGVAFHRSIRNFMIQGGDPTGIGKGGESIWGKPFKDEVNSKLLHSGRGVVSMANSGPHTNGSQFFILYKSANHLNFKHTVFGGVVGGLTTLAAMEKVPIDDDDRPLEEIKIMKVTVFVNPYTEPDEEDKEEDEKKVANEEDDKIGSWYSNPGTGTTEPMAVGGVGKYLKARTIQAEAATDNNLVVDGNAKKRKVEELAFLIKDNLYSKHLVLSTEQILIDFLQNDSSPDAVLDLEPMSSYHRLLVHRLADIFGFSHESVGEGDDRHIVLERCPESSIPSVLVSDILCQYDEYQPPTTTQHILRRKDVFPDLKTTRTAQPSAPLEERELAYEAARERIFSLHETDAKEPVTTKPRNVPVVARRMIAHALGQRISSNLHFHEASPLKSNEYGSTEELNQKIEVDRTLNNVGKQSSGLSTQNLALDENRGKVIGQSTSTSQVDKKMHNKMLTSPSNKEVCSRSNGRVVGIDNIEKQHHGAAKRMFAHALGLPPSKGDHGGGVLKCNEASKVSNSFGR